MSSIVTAVFKATIGLIVNKGRDKAAERLKDGDVTDQKFRGLIVREIDDVKSKLDGLSRKDLLTSVSFFKEGIELLYEVYEKARLRSKLEYGAVTKQTAQCDKAISLVKGVKMLDFTCLDESATSALHDAKKRFEDSRREATRAFNNEALTTSDRILAMQYRVMATILEKIDNPVQAVAPCKVCIDELHCLPAVQESFRVELTKGFRALFGKDERGKIISSVCHVNFVIYSVTRMACLGRKELSNWPCIGSREEKIDPLRDERLTCILCKQGMEHCCLRQCSFGPAGEEQHKLGEPLCIASNSSGQFIVGFSRYCNLKVYDSTGAFLNSLNLSNEDMDTTLSVRDVATDMKDNIHALVRLEKPGTEGYACMALEHFVYVFNDSTADPCHKFPVSCGRYWCRLAVTDSGKVVVLRNGYRDQISVYDTDGQFVCAFGDRKLSWAEDITAVKDGRVMVVDRHIEDSYVHTFTEHGDHLNKYFLRNIYRLPRIAFHRASEYIVFASKNETDLLFVDIYTKDGEFVRKTLIQEERIGCLAGLTVTLEGRIAVAFSYMNMSFKSMSSKVQVI